MQINIEKLTTDKNSTFFYTKYIHEYFSSPRHYHAEYEITYISKNNGKLFVGNNIIDFHAGDLYMFAPRLVHSFKNSEKDIINNEKSTASVILFDKDFCGIDFLYRKETFKLKDLLIISEKGIKFNNPSLELTELVKRIGEKKELDGIIDLLKILNLLSNHKDIEVLIRKYYNKSNFHISKDEKINNIIEYINLNISKDINFKEIAVMADMSVPSFSRFFKHRTGKNFTILLNELRIAHAQSLLMDTNKNIADISEECGYKNLSHFNRQFKLLNDITPKDFRNHFLK